MFRLPLKCSRISISWAWSADPNRVLADFFACIGREEKSKYESMRVLIQSTVTFLYLKDRDTATQNPDEARDFRHASRALRFVKERRMANVQIVLKFPKTSDDVNLAILELLDREYKKTAELPRAFSNRSQSRSFSV